MKNIESLEIISALFILKFCPENVNYLNILDCLDVWENLDILDSLDIWNSLDFVDSLDVWDSLDNLDMHNIRAGSIVLIFSLALILKYF